MVSVRQRFLVGRLPAAWLRGAFPMYCRATNRLEGCEFNEPQPKCSAMCSCYQPILHAHSRYPHYYLLLDSAGTLAAFNPIFVNICRWFASNEEVCQDQTWNMDVLDLSISPNQGQRLHIYAACRCSLR